MGPNELTPSLTTYVQDHLEKGTDMPMTVAKLHKVLGEMIAQGHGRKPACVSKDTFTHNCESDGVTILDVCTAKVKWIPWCDDDGGQALNKDGTEHGKNVLVLGGAASED